MADLRDIALNVVRVSVARALVNGASRQDINRVIDEAVALHRQAARDSSPKETPGGAA